MILKEFLEWSEKIKPEIEEVSTLLAVELSDEPETMIGQLAHIESWNGRVGGLLAQANGFLDRYKLYAMPPKDGERSETDRKILLDSEVSPIRIVRDTLEHFCDCIRQKLILGESLLAYHRQFAEHKERSFEKIY